MATAAGMIPAEVSFTVNYPPTTATKLVFTQQPATTAFGGIALTTQPRLAFVDDNGQLDASKGSSTLVTLAFKAGTNTGAATLATGTKGICACVRVYLFPDVFFIVVSGASPR